MHFDIFVIIVAVWIVIHVAHILLEYFMHLEWLSFLQLCGVTIKPFQVRWYCTGINRLLFIWGNWRPKLINKWFAVGALVTVSSMAPAVYILLKAVVDWLPLRAVAANGTTSPQSSLHAVIPGVNLPWSDLLYYFLALILISVIHEAGHALAAVREGVRIHGVGVFVFVLIPGAFVDLSTEQVMNLPVWNQLKIFCAGVWHNLSLAAVAVLLLLANPFLLSPLYMQHQGAVVAHVEPNFGAAGPRGLRTADLISGVNECVIEDVSSWTRCLAAIVSAPRDGYCVNGDFIEKERSYSLDPKTCCDESSERNLCFVQDGVGGDKLCLPARMLLEISPAGCNRTAECNTRFDASYLCLRPFADNNATKLVNIKRHGKPSVLFWGAPAELFQSVTLVNFRPKMTWLPLILIHYYETLLRYVISFSLALAILNVVPCFYLDGQWIAKALIEHGCGDRVAAARKEALATAVVGAGTVLLFTCVLLGFYQVLKN